MKAKHIRIKCTAMLGACKKEAHYFYEGRYDDQTEYFADCKAHNQGAHDDPADQSIYVKVISRDEYIIAKVMES